MKTVLNVSGMSCEHCVKAITGAVKALPGVSGVDVNLADGIVTVEHDPSLVSVDSIKTEIIEQGYEIVN